MRMTINGLGAFAAMFLLCACSVTFKVDVPDPELVKACVKDPTTSYETTKAEAANAIFTSTKASTVTRKNTFITNKQLGDKSADVTFKDDSKTLQNLRIALDEPNLANVMSKNSLASYVGAQLKALVPEGNILWNDPVHQELITIYNELVEGTNAQEKKFDVKELVRYQNASKDFALRGGWLAYAYAAFELIDDDKNREIDSVVNQALLQKFVGSMFVHAYLKAYFRNGKFIQGKWDLGNPFLKAFESLPLDIKQKLEKII